MAAVSEVAAPLIAASGAGTETADGVLNSFNIILLEPFFGGSHKQLIVWIENMLKDVGEVGGRPVVLHTVTLPDKKWHWKLRLSGAWAACAIPDLGVAPSGCLFASSMTHLTELLALRPELNRLKKVYYFHENQLVYPTRVLATANTRMLNTTTSTSTTSGQKRAREGTSKCGALEPSPSEPAKATPALAIQDGNPDFQFGWIQITSALTADVCVFNSDFNRRSFLSNIDKHMRCCPDKALRLPSLISRIEPKCRVMWFPVSIPATISPMGAGEMDGVVKGKPLTLLWNHRWEYDKNPDAFMEAVDFLCRKNLAFQLIVLGQQFDELPGVLARLTLLQVQGKVLHLGYVADKDGYWALLRQADVVLSTAIHEFFGVSVVEAIRLGCYPLLPNRLSYPELVAAHSGLDGSANAFLYNTQRQLHQALYDMARLPHSVREWAQSDAAKKLKNAFEDAPLAREYHKLICEN